MRSLIVNEKLKENIKFDVLIIKTSAYINRKL